MSETCPSCGAAASGRYCNECGAALNAACRECGSPLARGARFCNECGAAASPQAAEAPPAAGGSHRLPWIVAIAAIAALGATLLWPRRTAQDVVPPGGAPATFSGPGANGGVPDISQMTPRERADRLFDRVMRSASAGDTAQALQFTPMAIDAYQALPELSTDDRYHLAELRLISGDAVGARAEADTVLAGNPRHLLALFSAARAEIARGNATEGRQLFQRILEAYPQESVRRDVPEYQDHAQMLPIVRETAQRMTAGDG